jgi:hypothetical protein
MERVPMAYHQICIYWTLSYFKSRCVAIFTQHMVRKEIRTGKMVFTS